MAATIYLLYLLALLGLPLLVNWRWGLAAALMVTAVELGLGVPLAYWLLVPPGPYLVGYPIDPAVSPMEQIRRSQAHAYLTLIVWVMFPGIAALVGGGLAVAWWAVLALWRSAGARLA